MRPLPGDNAFGRQRSADRDNIPSVNSTSASQMSFFIADEGTVDSYLDQPSVVTLRLRDHKKVAESGQPLPVRNDDADRVLSRSTSIESLGEHGSVYSPLSMASLPSPTPVPPTAQNRAPLSRPMTPITLGTSVTGSLMSSPSSRRNSLAGSVSENAISSDDEGHAPERSSMDMADSGSAPQLVMPSIKMPSRRPFTETGRGLGRLKLLIAGKSGVGKTSLVKAIVQSCEHIVHVDPIVPPAGSRRSSRATARPTTSRRRNSNSTEAICEIFASTKSYPEWWTELDDARPSQRRKSLGDQVLDRNICFVDTPGYGNASSALETIVPCVEYVESHLAKVSSHALNEPEMLHLLGGDGGFQVDAVLYMIQRSLSPVDIEYLKRLAPLTNIIPILAQADSLSLDEQRRCKEQIACQLRDADLRYFNFVTSTTHPSNPSIPTIHAVSCAAGSDHDIMDASLLMSPDYVQPLASSELTCLVDHLFGLDGSSWLRHSAAKKYMQWKNTSAAPKLRHLYQPLNPMTGALIGRQPLALVRANCYTSDDEVPRVHIADWATDLQRSLASEKAQYETLSRGEQVIWLTEKLHGCVENGSLVSANMLKEVIPSRKKKTRCPASRKTSRHQDPLGLLQIVADLKSRSWLALEVLGGLGLFGGLAYWLARQRWQTETVHSGDDWTRIFGLDI